MTGHAAREAALAVKRQVLQVLAEKLELPLTSLDLKDGEVVIDGEAAEAVEAVRTEYIKEHRGWQQRPEGPRLTFTEASRLAFLERGTIVATGQYRPPPLGGKFKGAAVGTSPAYGCSAQVAEVQVDLQTGQVRVQRIAAAHDCGQAINATQVEGQMQGCVSMGLGEALMEEVVFDEGGKVQNANLADYRIPTALDMPPVDTILVESNEPNGPYGAKEVGEGGIMPTIPAILNAIRDATGLVIDELPASPERIVAALKARQDK
jgi:4-hydroxybenzoyl-CoA reductase subunit alpha